MMSCLSYPALNFNPRTPCGVRPSASMPPRSPFCDFNPRTPCGVRLSTMGLDARLTNFNPRTPCGVRLKRSAMPGPLKNFNPRTPCGVRLGRLASWARLSIGFQSTHPLRGATPLPNGAYLINSISIHAPLAGCDYGLNTIHQQFAISSHAPLAGCDAGDGKSVDMFTLFQSTHPLRGATSIATISLVACWHFNPRTPCGVRPFTVATTGTTDVISIHAPLAGCDPPDPGFGLQLLISIHAPLAGCDCGGGKQR